MGFNRIQQRQYPINALHEAQGANIPSADEWGAAVSLNWTYHAPINNNLSKLPTMLYRNRLLEKKSTVVD